jgi:hypothetical protein
MIQRSSLHLKDFSGIAREVRHTSLANEKEAVGATAFSLRSIACLQCG